MPIIKRGGGDLTRRSKKKKRTCSGGGKTAESLISGDMHRDPNQVVWNELSEEVASNLSRSVVSVALANGDTVVFACSGIAIECDVCYTRFLTSASLVIALNGTTKDHDDDLKIEVRCGGNVFIGSLQEYDLDHDIAVVNVMTFLDVHCALIEDVKFPPNSKVVAVGRDISDKLMATCGILTCKSSGSEDSEDLMLSTCKICEVWEGGALIDIEGNFVGMNLFCLKEDTVFLPASIILERLQYFRTSLRRHTFLARLENLKAVRNKKWSSAGKMLVSKSDVADHSRSLKKDKRTDDLSKSSKKNKRTDDLSRSSKKKKRTDDLSRSSKKKKRTDGILRSSEKNKKTDLTRSSHNNKTTCNSGRKTTKMKSLMSGDKDVLCEDRFGYLDSLGYPKLPIHRSNDGMVLVHTFEETFGDEYCNGVWSELSKTVSSDLSRNVVALASFYGEKRIFACSGLFIEWNGCTTILTSASLVSDFVDDKNIFENLRIEVLLSDNERREGTLQHYNLHYNVALVNVNDFCAPQPANIQPQRHNGFYKLVAVGRCFRSGILMAARGIHRYRRVKLDCKLLEYCTCEISKAAIGGPLVDFDGNFIGMSFYDMEGVRTPYLLWDVILDVLAYFKTKQTVAEVGHDGYHSDVLDWTVVGDESVRPNRWPVPKAPWCYARFVKRFLNPPADIGPRHRPCRPVMKIVNGKKYLLC